MATEPKPTERPAAHPDAEMPAPAGQEPSEPGKAGAAPLSPEEQMALFEQHLKENDWGHQPC